MAESAHIQHNGLQQFDGRRCLLVENNHFTAELLIRFFNKIGIAADAAADGREGLALFLKNPKWYDIIFTDLRMPVMDGYEMTQKIRESSAWAAKMIPIVAMSGAGFDDTAAEGGFDYILEKPFNLSRLPAVVAEVLNRQADGN